MKKIIQTLLILTIALPAFSQQVGIGTNNPNAKLDVVATDDGVLIPRVQLDDVNTAAPVTAPNEGLLIYNKTGTAPHGFYYWNNTKWVKIKIEEGADLKDLGLIAAFPGTTYPNDMYLPLSGGTYNNADFPEFAAFISNLSNYVAHNNYNGTFTLGNWNSEGIFLRGRGHRANPIIGHQQPFSTARPSGGLPFTVVPHATALSTMNGHHSHTYDKVVTATTTVHGSPTGNPLQITYIDHIVHNFPTSIANTDHSHYVPSASILGGDIETRPDNRTITWVIKVKPSATAVNNLTINNTIDTLSRTISLSGTDLSISDGNTIDIGSINTDNQNLTSATLSGTNLTIDIENGDSVIVDLASIDTDTDDQTLSLSGTNLSIADGNTIDIGSINTDNQNLTSATLSGTNLTIDIENGDSVIVDLASIDTDTQNTLNQAYNEGGAGAGRKITASDSAVIINGTDGLYVTGNYGIGTEVEISGAGTRMFFNPKKAAFRFGGLVENLSTTTSEATFWNNDSIGNYSFAGGSNTKATGISSFAFGSNVNAKGGYSFAVGNGTNAIGGFSVAMGTSTYAFGSSSVALGFNTKAYGTTSIAIGTGAKALGDFSLAAGMSSRSKARNSSTFGLFTQANGFASTVVGLYNDSIIASQTAVSAITPLFIVGNGDNGSTLSNAFVVRKNGSVQINEEYDLPTTDGTANQIIKTNGAGVTSFVDASSIFTDTDDQTLSLSGTNLSIADGNTIDIGSINTDTQNTLNQAYNEGGAGAGRKITASDSAVIINGTDGLYVTGTFGSGTDVEVSGFGERMFFNPKKGSFRVGGLVDLDSSSEENYWDKDSIGNYSFASGESTRATGIASTAMGIGSNSSGFASLSVGYFNQVTGSISAGFGYSCYASGDQSFATGDATTASGTNSSSFGKSTFANGYGSSAFGRNTKANGYASMVVGLYNDTIVSPQKFMNGSITNNTPLFIVGNGEWNAKSNAFVVRKDGRVQINDEYTLPTTDGTANQIIKTNGAGVTSFVDASSIFADTDDQTLSLSGTNLSIADGNTIDIGSINTDTQNTLNQAYNEGGAGIGRSITANNGAVKIQGTDGFLVTGTVNAGAVAEITGVGTRMFFNPNKSAFRAGRANSNNWDNANIGKYSFGGGYDSKASGDYSVAIGFGSDALAYGSTAFGNNSKSNGYYSTSLGRFTQANGFSSTVLGMFNDTILGSQTSVSSTTPLFIVGNGDDASTLSNALTVYKNGETHTEKIKVGSSANQAFTGMQGGTITVGADNSANDSDASHGFAVITYTFPTAFSSTPKLTLTPRNQGSTSYNDTFSVTIRSISATSVTINIKRTDSSASWGQNLLIDWFGFTN